MAFKTRNQEKFNEFDIRFESLERLFPSENNAFTYVYNSIKKVRKFFVTLTGRNSFELSSNQFEQLYKN